MTVTSNARVRPTKAELAAAAGKRIRDVIGPRLDVVFCGINPGLYSGAVGHHFARPGNRFWPALHASGFTERLFSPYEDRLLADLGFGVTNLVERTTAAASELSAAELVAGAGALERKARRFAPRWIAILGITAYRTAFERPKAVLGLQDHRLGSTRLWVLPNPSGLNAHHQPAQLAEMFREFRLALGRGING